MTIKELMIEVINNMNWRNKSSDSSQTIQSHEARSIKLIVYPLLHHILTSIIIEAMNDIVFPIQCNTPFYCWIYLYYFSDLSFANKSTLYIDHTTFNSDDCVEWSGIPKSDLVRNKYFRNKACYNLIQTEVKQVCIIRYYKPTKTI